MRIVAANSDPVLRHDRRVRTGAVATQGRNGSSAHRNRAGRNNSAFSVIVPATARYFALLRL